VLIFVLIDGNDLRSSTIHRLLGGDERTANAPQSVASVFGIRHQRSIPQHQNMRELAQEKQYQLWAQIDGKMVDAGVFDGNVLGSSK